ncbi:MULTISPECIES: lecithin retinol acyltransferase family protein [Cupriavidus]|uniref:lecithin retinol acyltransferase family protein n=1 Tax=Cupriavidus sp. DF5525 TaxID=3160989 RepID=UPI0032DFAB88
MTSTGEIAKLVQPAADVATCAFRAPDPEPPLGAHLISPRKCYAHHGIYVGDGMVVHYAGYWHRQQRGPVEALTLEAFADDQGIIVLPSPTARYSATDAVRRARSRLGEDRYCLFTNNCEHFCMWCLYGESRSEQVQHCMVHPLSGLRLIACMLPDWWNTAAAFGGESPEAGRLRCAPM